MYWRVDGFNELLMNILVHDNVVSRLDVSQRQSERINSKWTTSVGNMHQTQQFGHAIVAGCIGLKVLAHKQHRLITSRLMDD